jgi:hypothetical protein
MARTLHFNNENTLYLVLNIIGHDVIHDYAVSPERWKKNQILIKQFYSDYLTFSNPLKGGNGEKRGHDTLTQMETEEESSEPLSIGRIGESPNIFGFVKEPPRIKVKVNRSFSGPGQKIGTSDDKNINNYVNYVNALKENKKIMNDTIIFTFFDNFLHYFVPFRNTTINFKMSDLLLIPNNTTYPEVFEDLSNKFIGFCYENNISRNLYFSEYLNILCIFLKSYVVEQTIFENTEILETTDSPVKKIRKNGGKMVGGKDIELNVDEAKELVSQIQQLFSDPETISSFEILNDMLIKSENLTQEQKNQYTMMRKELLNQFKTIFSSNGQTKKAGSIEGDLLFIPPINVRRGRSIESINIMNKFSEKLNVLMLDINKIIKQSLDEKEAIERKRLKDLEASMKGELTSQDKEIRDNFIAFIAKSGLFLTGICSEQGFINTNYNVLEQNSTLRKQINILLYIANWTKNNGWNDVKTQDLDSVLLEFFEDKYNDYRITQESGSRYVCHNLPNYVVNNAANVENALKKKTFCPYSSILDGMSNCSWNTAQGYMESGNIDFLISDKEERRYYNGKMMIDSKNKENINLSFAVKFDDVLLNGNKSITINGSDLEAHFVLKNTLLNIINFILELDDATRNQVFAGGNIFENLFLLFSQKKELFNIVYSEILFKGTGDLFQEINCVTKYGAYTMDSSYSIDNDILSYKNTHGDQLRFFAANDRPSGTRFMFMLIHGNPTEINMKAVGGYYSENNLVLVKRKENTKICGNTRGGQTRYGRMKYRKTKKIQNKKKMYRFTNKNKSNKK